ncbi:polysaccharide deacetylase family protein [Kitasatospora sp. NBC_01287]|uniref:polysaccharide deacetylase family protein n=1 Tax=Kitasatospora sp. NBC_01287 TaxID=2903573 RepID=UPI0022540F0F|nr:polysaccharide deacetylase family protein [Kitasatospora sp. NBC_01287]MCX4750235.1 polysaccharide deacetylase family protein [Kitasatospora sp. NBC_01287]
MSVDRRRILRTTAQLATLTAAGPLLAACGQEATTAGGNAAAARSARAHPGAAAGTPTVLTPNRIPSATPSAVATAASPVAGASPPELPPLAASTPAEVVTGPRDRPQIALTFHGQGDPALATALLTAAEQHGARVTVLVVGTWLDQQPQMARRILDGGHELGNHTLSHLDISSMSADQAYAEIAGCADRLKALTGSIGRWFRPSAAQYATTEVKAQARRAGYEHVLSYDVDPRDYADPGAEVVQRRMLNAIKPGSIVALHMGHQGTVDALPAVLEALQQRGISAVTASQLCS